MRVGDETTETEIDNGGSRIANRAKERFDMEPQMTTKCSLAYARPQRDENGELRHAGMDGRHPGVQDASGDIHVGLDSSTPCWNDGIEESYQD